MHQGIAPAVDRFKGVVMGFADDFRMGPEQGDLAEVVPMAAGQSDNVVKAGGGVQVLAQLIVGGGAADEGLQGIERRGCFGRRCPRILAGQGSLIRIASTLQSLG